MEPQYRALVVEDSVTVRRILADQLKANGFREVQEASDGREALRMLFAGDADFDAMFVDWVMPFVPGIDVVKAARAAGYQLPIMMVTAQSRADEVLEAARAGVNDYLVKPFCQKVFAKKVERLVAHIILRKLGEAFRVRHAMTQDVVSVQARTAVRDAARLLVEHRVSGLPVVDSANGLVGIVTEFAVIERLFSPCVDDTCVGEVMSTEVHVVNENSLITEAAALIMQHKLRRVPVVRGRELVGIVARRDVVRFVLDNRDNMAKIIELGGLDRLESHTGQPISLGNSLRCDSLANCSA
jgi:two-component system, chemotaxis family, chemotaxis protein CheY